MDLQEYLIESIFDDDNVLYKKMTKAAIKAERNKVREFITTHYREYGRIKVSEKRNEDGYYEVSSTGNVELKWNSDRITDENFIWTEVGKNFRIYDGKMENLEGCPRTVGKDFILVNCEIKSLKGGPEYVGGRMMLSHCDNLTSLEYAPKQIGTKENLRTSSLHVTYCANLQSIEDCPKIVGLLNIYDSPKLKSLKGCPEKVLEINLQGLSSLTDVKYFPKSAEKIYIYECPIKSLKGICSAWKTKINRTDIENLVGMPDDKDGYFDLDLYGNGKLKSLKGAPSAVFNLNLSGCDKLTAQGMEDSDIHVRGRLNPPPGITYNNLPKGWNYVSLW